MQNTIERGDREFSAVFAFYLFIGAICYVSRTFINVGIHISEIEYGMFVRCYIRHRPQNVLWCYIADRQEAIKVEKRSCMACPTQEYNLMI